MIAAERLSSRLAGRPSMDGAEIVGWAAEIAETEAVRVGVRDSRFGGPYEGPDTTLRLAGALDLHWSDGQRSRVNLDRHGFADLDGELPGWRAAAYRDRSSGLPRLAGPADLPDVQTHDPDLALAVRDDSGRLLDLLDRIREQALAAGVRRVDGSLRALHGWRTVATSAGFRSDWEETACRLTLWGDEIAPARYGRRRLPSSDDLGRMVSQVARLAPLLRQEETLPASARGVILMPDLVDEMLARLLLPNLAGRAIRDGRSPFTPEDLDRGARIVWSDLDLVVDTTLPFELATAPCSSEGVPGGRTTLVDRGRLVSPIVDLATAHELGRAPTPVPRASPRALLLSQSPPLALDAAVRLLGEGAIVRDLPGLHTQQARRSQYALIAPDAQVVRHGRAGGRCAVRVAGNLLDHLNRPTTRLVGVPGELGVGLLVLDGCHLMPA